MRCRCRRAQAISATARAQPLLQTFLADLDDGYPATANVGSFAANPLGFHDLGGNVAEWTTDLYTVQPAGSAPSLSIRSRPAPGNMQSIRGSSWRHATVTELRAAFRDSGRRPARRRRLQDCTLCRIEDIRTLRGTRRARLPSCAPIIALAILAARRSRYAQQNLPRAAARLGRRGTAPADRRRPRAEPATGHASPTGRGARRSARRRAKGSPQRFEPTEKVRPDFDVAFPVDI